MAGDNLTSILTTDNISGEPKAENPLARPFYPEATCEGALQKRCAFFVGIEKEEAKMKKVEIITRQEKLNGLKELLILHNCQGMTVSSVMGCGRQRGYIPEMNIIGEDINLLPKIMVFTVIEDKELDTLLADITNVIGTGRAGDGKVFVYDVDEVVRIRTNERGSSAL